MNIASKKSMFIVLSHYYGLSVILKTLTNLTLKLTLFCEHSSLNNMHSVTDDSYTNIYQCVNKS